MMLNRYEREGIEAGLNDALAKQTGVRPTKMWVCDCGCDIAQWFARTDAGLAFTQQAWPRGATPKIMIFQTREEVDRFVKDTIVRMRRGPRAGTPESEERIRSFERTVWSAWAEA